MISRPSPVSAARAATGMIASTRETISAASHVPPAIDEMGFLENFSPGDLIYGFRECRVELVELLKKARPDYFTGGKSTREIYIDDINSPFFGVGGVIRMMQRLTAGLPPSESADKLASAISFLTYMLPLHEYKAKTDSRYRSMKGNTLMKTIKNGCKYGVLWAMESNPDKKIHFILNNIDFAECFGKTHDQYTNSELRFIYRNWEALRPFYETGRLNFYHKNSEGVYVKVQAPWMAEPSLAVGYEPKSHAKKKPFLMKQEVSVNLLLEELADAIEKQSKAKISESLSALLPILQSREIEPRCYESLVHLMGEVTGVFLSAERHNPFLNLTPEQVQLVVKLVDEDPGAFLTLPTITPAVRTNILSLRADSAVEATDLSKINWLGQAYLISAFLQSKGREDLAAKIYHGAVPIEEHAVQSCLSHCRSLIQALGRVESPSAVSSAGATGLSVDDELTQIAEEASVTIETAFCSHHRRERGDRRNAFFSTPLIS